MTVIEKAKKGDLQSIAETYEALIKHEKETVSYTNWVLGLYPTIKHAEKAFLEDSLYVLRKDGEVVGSMIVNKTQLDDYKKIKWEYEAPDEEVIVIHTLCIIPQCSGMGLGKKMVDFASELGRKKGCTVMRLDTYSGNLPAQAFYKKLGFRIAGVLPVLFMDVIPEDLMFLESRI